MTINKNFVVRNGLEVAQTLLCADDETNRVGINSANPEFSLDLYGDLRITGGLSVGGTTGRSGEYLESTGGALEWKAIPVLRVVETYTAVSGQVTFPSTGFLPYAAADFIDVFVDGVKLSQDEYTPSTGNTRIELIAPAFAGETVELVAYNASSIGVGGSGIQGITIGEEGVVVGTAGQVTNLNFVGASLTAIGSGAGVTVYFDNVVPGIATYASFSGVATYASSSGIASALTSTASVNTTGIITASRFVGDGSGLTGISGSKWVTTSVGIHTLSNVGFGTTNPTSKLSVTGDVSVSGVVTATSFSGSNTLKVRSTVSGATTSIGNSSIGNINITGFKSYALMKVGLSTTGWLRLYTDNASRSADASRSVGIDPSPGSGVIAEVVTTGISTTQIITPFVMGGNLNDPADTTIYAAVTNLSGITTSISVNLTLLQLEA